MSDFYIMLIQFLIFLLAIFILSVVVLSIVYLVNRFLIGIRKKFINRKEIVENE